MDGRRTAFVLLLTLVSGCASLRPTPQLPVANSVALDQLVIYGDFELPEEHRILRQLNQMRGQIAGQLGLQVTQEPIHVYLFKTPKRYRAFLNSHFPGFPDRRAIFEQTDTRLAVYAHWGDRIAEDLRHEVAHGYIHAAVPSIPMWIDEGLAEYFEVAGPRPGMNRPHLEQLLTAMRNGSWQPNVARLERLREVQDMQQIEYAEAWAWAHLLLETSPERRALLQGYLADLSSGRPGEALSTRILRSEADPNGLLLAYLEKLAPALNSAAGNSE